MDWDDYRIFSAIAETGAVRAAGQRLGIHPSTVSRRLEQLEQRLGVRLFTRTRSGLLITEEGSEVVQALGKVAVDLAQIERRLRSPDAAMTGEIRITLPDVFAAELLMRDFARFAVLHPAVRLIFLPSNQVLDLDRREADVAVRVTDSPPDNMVGRKLGSYSVGVYASVNYLAQHDPLGMPEACVWIESGFEAVRGLRFKARHFANVPLGPRCNSVLLQLAAARADMGLTVLPCVVADADPLLARVGDIPPVHAQDIWLLSHPDLRQVARVQRLTEFLVHCFAGLEDRFLGRHPARSGL